MLDGLLAEQAIGLRGKKKRGRGKKGTRLASIRYLEEQSAHDDANLVANSSTIPPPPLCTNRSRRFKIRSLTEPNSISGWCGLDQRGWRWKENREREREGEKKADGTAEGEATLQID